ncbi:MAG: outer membrane protein assembly factor [Methylomicrobium sp.]|nr:outer membrane protein assembly factor [Methylomicrobium sp.]
MQRKALLTLFLFFLMIQAGKAEDKRPDIKVMGLKGSQYKNVNAFLRLAKEQCSTPKWRINSLFKQADDDIRSALKALGYYQPEITKTLAFTSDCWTAEFTVDRGLPVKLTSVDVRVTGSAETDPAFQSLLAKNPLETGKTLNHGRYENLKSNLQSLALERGYLTNRFNKSRLLIDLEKHQAAVEISFDSGPRFYFGDIKIEQDFLNPDLVARFVNLEEDEYYSSKKLAQIHNSFSSNEYFSSIEIQPLIDQATDDFRVPVVIQLHSRKKHTYEVGLGYDTNYGPLFSAGYVNRRINLRGHSVSAALDISPVLSTVEARYSIPLQNPTTDSFNLGLGYKHEEPDTFSSDLFKLSGQRLKIHQNRWKSILSLDLIYEDYVSADTANSSLLLVPGGRVQYTESNSEVRATEGYHLNLGVSGAHESLLSDVSFVQASGLFKWLTAMPWEGRLITRGELGGTLVSDFSRLPASFRYFAGGAQTIRGYEYKELGPKNKDNEVIGGPMLGVLSVEYEKFIGDKWGVAAFIDSGNAFDTDDFSLNTGVGLGVRWISPVGPVRIDFAVPLDESGSSFQIHFAAGSVL